MIFSIRIYPYKFELNPPDLTLTYPHHIRVKTTLWHQCIFNNHHLGRTPFLALDNAEAYLKVIHGQKYY